MIIYRVVTICTAYVTVRRLYGETEAIKTETNDNSGAVPPGC